MKNKILTLICATLTATAAMATGEADVPQLEQTAMHVAAVPTASAVYGYAAVSLGQTGQFIVTAGANTTVKNSRFVDIFEFDDNGQAKLVQTINGRFFNFWGFKAAASSNVIAVWATNNANARIIDFYRRNGDKFEDTPFYSIDDIANVASSIAMDGNLLVLSTQQSEVFIYEVDEKEGSVTKVFDYTIEDGDRGISASISNGRVALLLANKDLLVIENQDNEWNVTSIECDHGKKNSAGESICIVDDEIYVGAGTGIYVYRKQEGEWTLSQNIEFDVIDGIANSSYGYSIRCNGTYLVSASNLIKNEQVSNYAYVYTRSANNNWTPAARLNPTSDTQREKVMSSCLVGNYFVYTNQMIKANGLTNAGGFFTYNFSTLSKAPGSTAVTNINAPETYDVYTIGGRLVRKAINLEQARQGLPRGLYIIGGKLVNIK